MRVKVRYNSDVKEMDVSKAMQVEVFRKLVEDAFEVEPALQRLIYSGKQFADGNDLMDYKVGAGHTITLMKRVVLGEIKEKEQENKEIDPDRDSGIDMPSTSSGAEASSLGEIRKICPELAEEMEKDEDDKPKGPTCKSCSDNTRRKCRECGCTACGGKNDPETQLFCEQCEYTTHMSCLVPPLTSVPEDDWYCPDCYVDKDEILKVGEKVKLTGKTSKMPSRIAKEANRKIRDWGRGNGCSGRRKVCTKVHIHHFGPVPGIEVGMSWESRMQLSEEGIHRPPVAGIAGKGDLGAQSIVLSGGYEDDVDNGIEFFYTGAGGRDLSNNKRTGAPVADQLFTTVNLALARNCAATLDGKHGATAKDWRAGKAIRVCRSYKAKKHSEYAPERGYRYDGIYKVVKYWLHRGASNFMVYRYLLRRDDPAKAPWMKGAKQFKIIDKEDAGGKKRKAEGQDEDGEDGAKKKKAKTSCRYTPDKEAVKAVAKDGRNKKMWDECLGFECETALEFLNNVEEHFTCICCSDLLHRPITTECGHNMCRACFERAIKADYLSCPHCRQPLDKGLKVNEECSKALKKLFPGYDAHRA